MGFPYLGERKKLMQKFGSNRGVSKASLRHLRFPKIKCTSCRAILPPGSRPGTAALSRPGTGLSRPPTASKEVLWGDDGRWQMLEVPFGEKFLEPQFIKYPPRELTYPTKRQKEHHLQKWFFDIFGWDMLVARRVMVTGWFRMKGIVTQDP